MFTFAFSLGLYAYLIFTLGLMGVLYKPLIIGLTIIYFTAVLNWKKDYIISYFRRLDFKKFFKSFFSFNVKNLLILLFILQSGVNLIGALGPEIAFDALWYHLTFPKLYLDYHTLVHISGSLLYYSDMPKLGEMFYVSALTFGDETLAKLFHFSFGLFTCLVVYKITRSNFSQLIALIAVLIFSSNLVFAWESTTAYIDLIRTFFELMCLWGFIQWYETRSMKWLIESAALLGLAVSTKLLALGSLIIFICLFVFIHIQKKEWKKLFVNVSLFSIITFLVPLPWFVFSYIHTGNPVYPFFTGLYEVSPTLSLNPLDVLIGTWNIFTRSSDPLSPLYLIFAPLVFIAVKYFTKQMKLLCFYSLLGIVAWYITPQTGGGRFILAYLPVLSIVCAAAINEISKDNILYKFVLSLIIFVSLTTTGYRAIANSKYTPVILGQESKEIFLSNNLNFSYGDFYDTDNYFERNFTAADKVLLYGFHNLYYVNFPFIHESWVAKGDRFNYIATQNTKLPERFKTWQKIYYNEKTNVTVYTDNSRVWQY